MGGVVTGSFTFLDPYDDRVGVLVAPDIDHHIELPTIELATCSILEDLNF
jgi:hypothetical protein